MRIAKLYMDPQDKLRFEIQGKSSVKYHLKANHQVEAKRWFWALNNAIQWSKDEAREEERRQKQESDALKQAKIEVSQPKETDNASLSSSHHGNKNLPSGTHYSNELVYKSWLANVILLGPNLTIPVTSAQSAKTATSTVADEEYGNSVYEPSVMGGQLRPFDSNVGTTVIDGDVDDEDDYGDDASSREIQPTNKDAFNITAQSARLQLELLAQVSSALHTERERNPSLTISDPTTVQALSSYEAAVSNLKGLIGDLLRISRDRDAYWQFRLDREANVRRMWEESMARVAKEQEELETRIGESELRRKKTKQALRQALENFDPAQPRTREGDEEDEFEEAPSEQQPSFTIPLRKKSTIADIPDLSDSDSEEEEFFDAVGAGEVEVVEMPLTSPPIQPKDMPLSTEQLLDDKKTQIEKAFKGYEDPPRSKLAMDEDNRPKISLWVSVSC